MRTTLTKLLAGLTAVGLMTAVIALAEPAGTPAVASLPDALPAAETDAAEIDTPAVDMHDWLDTRRPPLPRRGPPPPPKKPKKPVSNKKMP